MIDVAWTLNTNEKVFNTSSGRLRRHIILPCACSNDNTSCVRLRTSCCWGGSRLVAGVRYTSLGFPVLAKGNNIEMAHFQIYICTGSHRMKKIKTITCRFECVPARCRCLLGATAHGRTRGHAALDFATLRLRTHVGTDLAICLARESWGLSAILICWSRWETLHF